MGRGNWRRKTRRGEGREKMQVTSRKLKSEVKKVEMEEDDHEEEEEVMIEKWANHYSSFHDILLVGEGDFSFSLCLANAFGSAANIVATSLDSYDILLKKYSRAKSNLERLKEMGATIIHEVDSTKMKFHVYLTMRKFDRIVFNFPHAGFKGKEDNMRLINLHKQLVNGFFKNASHMLRPRGEVHVSHKIGGPFCRWNLKELALKNSLILAECANFSIDDYPGYNNKRGDGHRCDHPFPLGECRTFKFRIGSIHEIKRCKEEMSAPRATNMSNSSCYPPRYGTRNSHQHHPEIETPFMAGYQPYASEAEMSAPRASNMSNSSCYPPRYGTHSSHHVHPRIENPFMAGYQPYASEAFRDDVLFRYWKHQEEVRNRNYLARLGGLNIECYQPCANEAFLNLHPHVENLLRVGRVLSGYFEQQEEAWNRRNLAR